MSRHLLRKETIKLGLMGQTKKEVFAELLELIPGSTLKPVKRKKLLEALLGRERFGTTAIGEGIALPHVVSDVIDQPIAALGLSREGIDFASLDGEPVHLCYLLLLPQNAQAVSSKKTWLLGAQAVLSDSFVSRLLHRAGSAEEIYTVLNERPEWLSDTVEVLAAS